MLQLFNSLFRSNREKSLFAFSPFAASNAPPLITYRLAKRLQDKAKDWPIDYGYNYHLSEVLQTTYLVFLLI